MVIQLKLSGNVSVLAVKPDSRADKLIDCALFDKSTKVGTEVV